MMRRNGRAAILVYLSMWAIAVPQPPAQAKPSAYAIIAGTVFRENGLSLRGASVTLSRKDAPKFKKLHAVSDERGEFAFHVPPVESSFRVEASMKGFQTVTKETSIRGEERMELSLVLAEAK